MEPTAAFAESNKQQSNADCELVEKILAEFGQLRAPRSVFESHWEEVSELVDPPSRNTFTFGSYNTPGEKKTERQVDATGMMALSRFKAICDSLLTPRNMEWHALTADNDYLMKDRQTRLWFESTTRKLFKYRYAPSANFSAQNQGVYHSLGAYGTGVMFVDQYHGPEGIRGLRYKNVPLGEMYLRENHQGVVIGFVRWFRLTAMQAKEMWPDNFPDALLPQLNKRSEEPLDFLHYVMPNNEYDPERVDADGMLYRSYYVCLKARWLMSKGGYTTFPLSASRYEQTPGEIYGRSPAMMVLPALKTLNAEKRVFLKQGHRAADPVLLTADDGIVDFSLKPGALNKGGVNSDGRPLVHALPAGAIQISKEMMAEEKMLINDAFLVTLFQVLTETPTMTATEVIERTNEKGILLAPTVGRQQSEYLGPLINRELDLLASLGVLDPMPELLREAQGEYQIVYTSPLSRAMRAQDAAGFMRTLEPVRELVNITQDPSLLDPFDFDVAIPEIARINGTPESWMASEEQVAAKREQRAAAAKRQEEIQAAPAQAAMMKAQAVAAEKGAPPT